MSELNTIENRQKAAQSRRANMTPIFELNRLTKKKRALETRIINISKEKAQLENSIQIVLQKMGIEATKPFMRYKGYGIKEGAQDVLKDEKALTVAEIRTKLDCSYTAIFYVLKRYNNKLFVKNGNLWSLKVPVGQ